MKKKGSAILAVLGCITVLAVLAFAFIGSSREKKGISRLMSDEKKCEALAESASDFIIQFIRKAQSPWLRIPPWSCTACR